MSTISGLAVKWRGACKTLRRVSFPNGTWVHNQRYGWLTLNDMERLLMEREKALQEREAKERALYEEQRALEDQGRRLETQIRSIGVDRDAL
ncbi:hypothetical protein SERLA73DRAFT_180759 [Serpula lacrymans var. lacrymans S7.3]|uniref:Uncharacterized protein n=2 Tax=Serpula lacrymans var. lacrymans TaxID=341189 RepID=F8PW87_SERL3|nr:hypothetical protein SERLA73DRAFT_180759 [Serpula lacrymans var. lacrymans S7.3]